jgi:(2R)-sulfolactate sulfo-lyase subunit alpha
MPTVAASKGSRLCSTAIDFLIVETYTTSERDGVHKFLVHQAGDHVGVATAGIDAGEHVQGVFMDDGGTVEVDAAAAVPLSHKIAIRNCEPGGAVIEYGVRIGIAPDGLRTGDYVHVHNLKSARWGL